MIRLNASLANAASPNENANINSIGFKFVWGNGFTQNILEDDVLTLERTTNFSRLTQTLVEHLCPSKWLLPIINRSSPDALSSRVRIRYGHGVESIVTNASFHGSNRSNNEKEHSIDVGLSLTGCFQILNPSELIINYIRANRLSVRLQTDLRGLMHGPHGYFSQNTTHIKIWVHRGTIVKMQLDGIDQSLGGNHHHYPKPYYPKPYVDQVRKHSYDDHSQRYNQVRWHSHQEPQPSPQNNNNNKNQFFNISQNQQKMQGQIKQQSFQYSLITSQTTMTGSNGFSQNPLAPQPTPPQLPPPPPPPPRHFRRSPDPLLPSMTHESNNFDPTFRNLQQPLKTTPLNKNTHSFNSSKYYAPGTLFDASKRHKSEEKPKIQAIQQSRTTLPLTSPVVRQYLPPPPPPPPPRCNQNATSSISSYLLHQNKDMTQHRRENQQNGKAQLKKDKDYNSEVSQKTNSNHKNNAENEQRISRDKDLKILASTNLIVKYNPCSIITKGYSDGIGHERKDDKQKISNAETNSLNEYKPPELSMTNSWIEDKDKNTPVLTHKGASKKPYNLEDFPYYNHNSKYFDDDESLEDGETDESIGDEKGEGFFSFFGQDKDNNEHEVEYSDEDSDMWVEEKAALVRKGYLEKNMDNIKMTKTHSTTYVGHSAWLCSIATIDDAIVVANDGDYDTMISQSECGSPASFLTGSGDSKVKLWDVETGSCLKTYDSHDALVWSIVVDSPGTFISGSGDHLARLFSIETGDCIRTYVGHTAAVYSVASLLSAGKFLTGSNDCSAKLWDTETGQSIHTFNGHHTYAGWKVCPLLSSKGEHTHLFLTASWDQQVFLWDMRDSKAVRSFKGHEKSVEALIPAREAEAFLTGSDDKSVKFWDLGSGKVIHTYEGHAGCVTALDTIDDDSFVSVSGDGSARLWKVESGECLCSYFGHCGELTATAALDDMTFLTGSEDNSVKRWRTDAPPYVEDK